jgi:cytochrome c-type biogenesis protein CcmH
MGWLILLGLALLVALGIGFFARRDRGALQFLIAALLLALAGYSWQGRPGLAGAPKTQPARQQLPQTEFAKMRGDTLGRFDGAARWLNMADALQSQGDNLSAAQLLQGAARRNPRDVDLWIGLGNALMLASDGQATPASELAFRRAQEIAPDHPAPRFFYGIALAQGGNYDQAERIWRQMAEGELPESYRRLIDERLQAIENARAAGEIPPRAVPQPPQSAPAPAPAPAR